MSSFTLAIIAGGKSSRMGTDKAFVTLGGKTMIEHIVARTADLGQEKTILITNRPDDYVHLGLPMYSDILPEKGSLGGIYTALYYSPSPYMLAVACDMPFLNPVLLRHMLSMIDEQAYDVIVPRVDGYPEGMHAIYSRVCLVPIRQRLEQDRLKIIGFYDDVRVRYLDEAEWQPFDADGLSFQNVNTPEELAAAQQHLQE